MADLCSNPQTPTPSSRLLEIERLSVSGDLSSTPQGSILSPALYNIYTSDFPIDNNITVCLFADDAALLCTRKTVEEAINLTQNYIYKLELWLTKLRIAINTDKTHAIVFRKLRSHNSPPPLQIFNSTIEWTFQVKYQMMISSAKRPTLLYLLITPQDQKHIMRTISGLERNPVEGHVSIKKDQTRIFIFHTY
ncbi:RNA-directed DNA polymerase from mobile element jockey [Trichonephila clavipes]|nr:RNA-directed DNA polymerase from mobile element jockey [Trichonephila clavipes]